MQIRADQLVQRLRRALAPIYLVYGDEPLLVEEAAQAICQAAHAAGYTERQVLTVDSGFDWEALYASLHSPSLFSLRRVVELRLPSGRPGDRGATILRELAARPPAEVVLLVRCGRLERREASASWVQALERAGVTVAVYPLEPAQWPAWITRRMRDHGLKPAPGVVELLVHHMEGNLLAAAQEIEKLALHFGEAEIRVDDIEEALCDNARFSVFALVDACLKGEGASIIRIVNSLRAEGIEPGLVLWALVRELRTLAQMARELVAGKPLTQVLGSHQVWAKRQPLVSAALQRRSPAHWHSLLTQAARVERVIKGRQQGDPWQALQCLGLALGGIRVQTCEAVRSSPV